MADGDAVEAALRERGPLGEDAPADAVLTGWTVVCEWATPDGPSPGARWYDQDSPSHQGSATTLGLMRIGEDMAGG